MQLEGTVSSVNKNTAKNDQPYLLIEVNPLNAKDNVRMSVWDQAHFEYFNEGDRVKLEYEERKGGQYKNVLEVLSHQSKEEESTPQPDPFPPPEEDRPASTQDKNDKDPPDESLDLDKKTLVRARIRAIEIASEVSNNADQFWNYAEKIEKWITRL